MRARERGEAGGSIEQCDAGEGKTSYGRCDVADVDDICERCSKNAVLVFIAYMKLWVTDAVSAAKSSQLIANLLKDSFA